MECEEPVEEMSGQRGAFTLRTGDLGRLGGII